MQMNTKTSLFLVACTLGLACTNSASDVIRDGSAGGSLAPGGSSGTAGSLSTGGATSGISTQTGGNIGGTTNAISSSSQSSGGTTSTSSSPAGGSSTGGETTSSGGSAAADAGVDRAQSGGTPAADADVDRPLAGGSGGTATTSAGGSGGVSTTAATGGSGGQSAVPDAGTLPSPDGGTGRTWQQIQSDFIDLRFGMFICLGILTYTGSWGQANLPINQFNPANLDCNQWATAAASAKMKFGVLTTRHHDGFALWPSKASTFNVGSIPWRSGKGDVVQEYVTAFRAKGLEPGLYYSIWDSTQNNGNNGALSATQMQYIKTQLTELLSNYGKIPLLVLDGWAWKMGHRNAPFAEIHDFIKSLQPEILIVDHDGIQGPWDADLVMYEEPKGVFSPTGNTIAAAQDNKINGTGGNDWYWAPDIGSLMTVSSIVDGHLKKLEAGYTNFILNCPPNRDGQLDAAIVTILGQVGSSWTPNAGRPPLPTQPPLNEHPYMPTGAIATSGTAFNAIDGVNDVGAFGVWTSSTSFPQSLTIDLGSVKPDVGYFGYLPGYSGSGPTTNGSITSYKILVSSDNSTYTVATSGAWPGDGKYKGVLFGPVAARYVRLEADAANGGGGAQATEVVVGARR
jgi:alpha-L-fucosidase